MACAAYDLACTWPRAGCTACSMCEDTILGLETTARYRPETNPPGGSGVGGKLRHPPSHLTEAILRAMDWHQQAASLWRCTHYLLKSQHRSTNNLELLRCLH